MNLLSLTNHRTTVLTRWVLGQAAIGLALAWWALFLLELWRPGLLSWYLNLNLLLALAIIAWALGSAPAPAAKPTKLTYGSPALSAILLVGLALTLTVGTVAVWWVPLLTLVSILTLFRLFPRHV